MKLNYKKTILVGFAFFLICAFWQAYDTIIPMILVNRFGLNQTASGVIMALDNIIALFMLPLFGSLSDKSTSKKGKRTPFIVIGTVLAVVCFIGLSFSDNVQLNKLEEVRDPLSAYDTLWVENPTISNSEYSTFSNKNVAKSYKLQDYVARINYNKDYASCTMTERDKLKEWYNNINKEYFEYVRSKDKNTEEKYETVYHYDKSKNEYDIVEIEVKDGKVTYMINDGKDVVKKENVTNAYINLITPARQQYAWKVTKTNYAPFVFFIILLLMTLFSMSIFRSPAVALMPDVTIKPLRSQGNAVINLMGTVGGMTVLLLGMLFATGKSYNQMMSYVPFIAAVCAVMLVALFVFMLTVKEPAWVKEMQADTVKYGIEEEDEKQAEGERKLTKSERVSFILILASVALWYMGYNAVTSKYSLYASTVLQMDYNTTLLIAQVTATIAFIPVGLLASKIGRRKSILIGVTLLFGAFIGAIFLNSNSSAVVLNLLFAVAGIGWATINVNSFPMVVELAKCGDTGKYTGYYYVASMSAQVATPILSGLIMDSIGSMRPLFYYAAFFVLASFVTMLFVKHGDNKPQKKISVIENFDVDD